MEQFFRPREFNSHTSLVSQMLGIKKEPRSIHERLHNHSEKWTQDKAIREHVLSVNHIQRSNISAAHLMNKDRQSRREHWEIYNQSVIDRSSRHKHNSYLLHQNSHARVFGGHRTSDQMPRKGVYANSLMTDKPTLNICVRGLEKKYGIGLYSSKHSTDYFEKFNTNASASKETCSSVKMLR